MLSALRCCPPPHLPPQARYKPVRYLVMSSAIKAMDKSDAIDYSERCSPSKLFPGSRQGESSVGQGGEDKIEEGGREAALVSSADEDEDGEEEAASTASSHLLRRLALRSSKRLAEMSVAQVRRGPSSL